VQRLQQTVLPTLIDNLRLSEKSQRAGQIGVLDVIVVNRQALDARRDLLEALSEYHTTRFALQAAAGIHQE
jgi:cobalt-zinc-cadmium efflux system outer membrane protein